MQKRKNPLLIFANMVNELMIGVPSHAYVKSLSAVSTRKIWLSQEGDVIITPHPMDILFKRYACAILGIDPNKIITICPDGEPIKTLASRVYDSRLIDTLCKLIDERPGIDFLCFAQDNPTLELVKELRIPLHGYDSLPDVALQEMVYRLNTKSGFRSLAEDLGLSVVPGAYCEGIDDLISTVEKTLKYTGRVIVKYDRSSNGYGNIIFGNEELTHCNMRDYLIQRIALFSEQPHIFTVEAFMPFVRVPSVEIVVENSGYRPLYLCDQRCPKAAFTGLVTPPIDLEPEVKNGLLLMGRQFGDYVRAHGFRGVCDIDTGVTKSGMLYATESNFRRTGGTYIDTFMRRLFGNNYVDSHVWWADARIGTANKDFFAGLSAIEAAKLSFDSTTGDGVILTADTLQVDGKWRYLIIASNPKQARDIESKLEEVLQLSEFV